MPTENILGLIAGTYVVSALFLAAFYDGDAPTNIGFYPQVFKGFKNKRLNQEAKFILLLLLISISPLLSITLVIHLLYLLIRVFFVGVANLFWVGLTSIISQKTHIPENNFDEWRAQVENFIESIPSSTGATKCET
jgi:hypothetical protein